jgi:hypothetical protein
MRPTTRRNGELAVCKSLLASDDRGRSSGMTFADNVASPDEKLSDRIGVIA